MEFGYNFIMKYMFMIFIMFSLSACQLFEDSKELQEKKQELALKTLQAQQDKDLANLEMQQSLVIIEKEKLLELQKLQNEIKAQELNTNSEAELELIKQKVTLQESNNTLDFQKYLLMFLALLLIVISGFIFYYFKKKRENELRAYEDNLKKYFYHKENEARLKIADKILDTLKGGDLSKENEQKLINAFTKETSSLTNASASFAKEQHDYNDDAEIVEVLEHKENNE